MRQERGVMSFECQIVPISNNTNDKGISNESMSKKRLFASLSLNLGHFDIPLTFDIGTI